MEASKLYLPLQARSKHNFNVVSFPSFNEAVRPIVTAADEAPQGIATFYLEQMHSPGFRAQMIKLNVPRHQLAEWIANHFDFAFCKITLLVFDQGCCHHSLFVNVLGKLFYGIHANGEPYLWYGDRRATYTRTCQFQYSLNDVVSVDRRYRYEERGYKVLLREPAWSHCLDFGAYLDGKQTQFPNLNWPRKTHNNIWIARRKRDKDEKSEKSHRIYAELLV